MTDYAPCIRLDQPTLPGLTPSPVGLTQTGPLDEQACIQFLKGWQQVEALWSFAIGDFVLAALAEWGPTKAFQLLAEANLSQAHVGRCAAVAERIPITRRRATLSWSHHELVAHLPDRDQERHLQTADHNHLTVRALRDLIRQETDDLNPALPGLEKLPQPPATLLRQLLAKAEPDSWILWQPSTGTMRLAEVA